MAVFVGEGDDLRLDAGAVARPDALYLSVVEGRAVEGFAQHRVARLVGVERVARELTQGGALWGIHIGELMEVLFALLHAHLLEVQTACIDTGWCPCLHAVGAYAHCLQLVGDAVGRWLGDAPTAELQLTEVHQSREECPCRQDDRFGREAHP